MLLPITLTIAAACALINFWLSMRCGQVRLKQNISVGDGGNLLLVARMRAHSNFTENAPIFVILLGLIELGGGSQMWLWIAGIIFVIARIGHAIGMERPYPNKPRQLGMVGTGLPILVLAGYAIYLSYGGIVPVHG